MVYGPPGPFLFDGYLLYTLSDRTMHKFGVVVHVQYSTKSSTSTRDRSLKMNRLLFTLTVVVLMAAHGGYCTTLKLNEL